MKKKQNKSLGASALQIAIALALTSISAVLFASSLTQRSGGAPGTNNPQPDRPMPDVVRLIGPVMQNKDLRDLPYVAQNEEAENQPLTRYPHPKIGAPPPAGAAWLQSFVKAVLPPTPNMPTPSLTFEGTSFATGGAGWPPDTNGDVGPNHYVETVNTTIQIFDKSGNSLSGPTTFNSFFSELVGTPCQTANNGDPFVFYDHLADRWVISDFAFPSFPGSSFFQCIGVSQTGDPTGAYFLYALQIDPANPNQLGDYPKFAMWNSGGNPAQNAYFFTVNLFSTPTTFNGVRAFALDRASMIAGGPANAIAFTVPLAGVGNSYSFVPATFRTGDPPPAGRDEMLLAIDSPATGGVTLTQVHARFFHVDFATPG
ncbi:MAG: hypothetical protein J2P56_11485, partial [Verrucomicrobia bacterium]|nr:hypothetical protein [Verrucomicrobiota bacterium]